MLRAPSGAEETAEKIPQESLGIVGSPSGSVCPTSALSTRDPPLRAVFRRVLGMWSSLKHRCYLELHHCFHCPSHSAVASGHRSQEKALPVLIPTWGTELRGRSPASCRSVLAGAGGSSGAGAGAGLRWALPGTGGAARGSGPPGLGVPPAHGQLRAPASPDRRGRLVTGNRL